VSNYNVFALTSCLLPYYNFMPIPFQAMVYVVEQLPVANIFKRS